MRAAMAMVGEGSPRARVAFFEPPGKPSKLREPSQAQCARLQAALRFSKPKGLAPRT